MKQYDLDALKLALSEGHAERIVRSARAIVVNNAKRHASLVDDRITDSDDELEAYLADE